MLETKDMSVLITENSYGKGDGDGMFMKSAKSLRTLLPTSPRALP